MSPAGETAGTSSTPPRANVPAHSASKIESTPNSRGATVVSDNIGVIGVKVKKVGPWIQRDIEQAKECKADAMLQVLLQRASSAPKTKQPELLQKCLKAVLPVCNGQTSTPLVESSDVHTALNEYIRPGVENKFYSPFIRATNTALACLEDIKVDGMRAPVSAVDMICQQNDMPMHQTHQTAKSIRKPDLVILPLNSACAPFEDVKGGKKGKQKGKRKDDVKDDKKDDTMHDTKRKAHMDTNATAKPKNLPWKDVLACIEFKRKTPGRTKGIKPPPSSYVVKDYVPTKPEYLPVDHLKVEDPEPNPSQTPATQPAPDPAFVSSGLTASQPCQGGSSSKRKATDPLESAAKKSKMDPDDADEVLDVTVQTGLYGAEMFASNLGVNHLLNIIVVDDVMWIWYYDRQGIIQCSGINFIQDLPRFMVLLYALQRFRLEDWGRSKVILPIEVEGKQCHELTIKDETLGEVDLLLHTSHDDRVTHYGLQGRATNVVPVTSQALAQKYGNFQDGMVAKIFWGEASRTSEPEILKKVEEIARVHHTVQDHIPELLWHHVFTNPTSTIREALGVPEPTKGSRVLYILVFPKLHPITKLDGKVLFDRTGHLTLWKEGVYHRDVSPGNLMWYWKDGKRIGVLNDYDLSSLADDSGPRGNERTGTVPFMARELLTMEGQRGEVKHLYRHDLESFMWVFAWICLRYRQGVLLPRRLRPFDEWATLGPIACGEKKLVFLNNMTASAPSDMDQVTWDFLVDCFLVLKKDTDNRYYLRLKRPSSSGEYQQPNADSDFDAFLSKFTSLEGWVELSKL
ncbi:hypothetical protein BDR07DRAFT_1610637 [Suillus spraguei]|nr:hypothetical protein BDR07DRAFT_1610637 [Suillus spraguei]